MNGEMLRKPQTSVLFHPIEQAQRRPTAWVFHCYDYASERRSGPHNRVVPGVHTDHIDTTF